MHGLSIIATLGVIQVILDEFQNNFMLYLPPIGFGLFIIASYVIQPIIVGVVNVTFQCRLYKRESCPTGFLLSGLFLLLMFSTTNSLLTTVLGVTFSAAVAIVEAIALAIPFGYLARFSTGQ
jgi:Na+-transporting NADH:ubiquinone oxidoreductase subunit NqrB